MFLYRCYSFFTWYYTKAFSKNNITENIDLFSLSAYDPESHEELPKQKRSAYPLWNTPLRLDTFPRHLLALPFLAFMEKQAPQA